MIDDANKLKVAMFSLHGLIRANEPELGRDSDTGGQIIYVLELAEAVAKRPEVEEVTLFTRQIFDSKVSQDYSQLEERISENAKIVRIPFGPKKYLRKELLWSYLELCIDQTLTYFKRHGLPDVIHGHYADAGMVGAQLSRLLHVPFIFTGHSLGRVKRERLSLGKKTPEQLEKQEKKFNFPVRIEAEEMALETASMVITSTNQEVREQYELYDQYVPDRMEVIPPGVDLSRFTPVSDQKETPSIHAEINKFLRDPDKPAIFTMARPDERKNLEMLVRVYGESEQLRALANLILIMGNREDLRELPKQQRKVLDRIFELIDIYDLYGSVAYPKSHHPSDVPDMYRMVKDGHGVFINPAFTEPFGLTLLEAAGTGLPIVATNDGGPTDIIANCHNGLLVDPIDQDDIEKALLRVLTERENWTEWSENGIKGVHSHYTWEQHANRYVRNLKDIIESSTAPALATGGKVRRIPDCDRLIITDLDNTLTGDDESLHEFLDVLKQHDNVGFGIATGRPFANAQKLIEKLNLPRPDILICSVGTEVFYGEKLTPDLSWQKQIRYQWMPDQIRELLDQQPGFYPQKDDHQSECKVSYEIDTQKAPKLSEIRQIIRDAGLRSKIIFSLDMYLDIVPIRAGSDLSLRHILYRWGFSPDHVLVAGDSGNDEGMLKGRTLGVVVGNHGKELKKLKKWPRIYFAEGHNARGILEGIDYYNFFDHITIPNDSIDEQQLDEGLTV